MTRPLTLTALLVTLAACGGAELPALATPVKAVAPKGEAAKAAGPDYFDVATVTSAPPALPDRPGSEGLLGVDLAARPALLECLVDPKNRGGEKATHVVVDTSAGAAGVEHKITGANLTPTGTACLEGVLKAWTKGIPAGAGAPVTMGETPKPPAQPVTSHLELDHVVGAHPAVVLGVDDASDVAAAVRLALPGWGECFAGWKSAAPRILRASLKAAKAKDAAPAVLLASVAFEPTSDPVAGKVAACLEGKLKALPIKPPASESVTVPYTFRLVHSGIEGLLPDAPPDLQLVELDLQRSRRLSDVTLAVGEHAQALSVYDDMVKRFKARARPEVTVAQLTDRCAALLAADDRLLAAAERQTAVEDATHHFAEAQKAKDPGWTEAEATSAKSLADVQKELESYKGLRRTDERACPKTGGR